MVWLGLVQPGGRNILSNQVVINNTTQVWVNGDSLRIDYTYLFNLTQQIKPSLIHYRGPDSTAHKIALHPLRSPLNFDDAEAETEFQDFVANENNPTTAETAKDNTNNDESENNNGNSENNNSNSKNNNNNASSNDNTQIETKDQKVETDILAGKKPPSFAMQVVSILQQNTELTKGIFA